MAIENPYIIGSRIEDSFLGTKFCLSLLIRLQGKNEEETEFVYSLFCEVFDDFDFGFLEFRSKVLIWVAKAKFTYVEVIKWK